MAEKNRAYFGGIRQKVPRVVIPVLEKLAALEGVTLKFGEGSKTSYSGKPVIDYVGYDGNRKTHSINIKARGCSQKVFISSPVARKLPYFSSE